jgi:hypothetical protein
MNRDYRIPFLRKNNLKNSKFSCTFPAQLCKLLKLNGAGEGNRTLVSVPVFSLFALLLTKNQIRLPPRLRRGKSPRLRRNKSALQKQSRVIDLINYSWSL